MRTRQRREHEARRVAEWGIPIVVAGLGKLLQGAGWLFGAAPREAVPVSVVLAFTLCVAILWTLLGRARQDDGAMRRRAPRSLAIAFFVTCVLALVVFLEMVPPRQAVALLGCGGCGALAAELLGPVPNGRPWRFLVACLGLCGMVVLLAWVLTLWELR